MNTSPFGRLGWRNIRIGTKFVLTLGAQLLLVAALALSAIFAFDAVRRQRDALREAQRLQSLADSIRLGFTEARLVQNDLMLSWDRLGYSMAVQQWVPAHAAKVEDIQKTTGELGTLLEGSAFQSAERAKHHTETLAAVTGLYQTRFLETVDALEKLANEEDGALIVLNERARTLEMHGAVMADTEILESISTIRWKEEQFRTTGDPLFLYDLRSEASLLDKRLGEFAEAGVRVYSVRALQEALDAYLEQLDTVEQLTADFGDKVESLDALITEVEPIWLELAELGGQEAALAQARADRISRLADVLLRAGVALAVGMGAVVTFLLWRDFDASLMQLTGAATRLKSGDMSARAEVVGSDEFSQLADTFNAMAAQLQGLVSGLEAQAIERARNLETIADISRTVTSLRNPEALLREVVELVRERFGFYHAQVFLVDEAGEYAVLRESTGEAGRQLLARGHRLAIGSQSVIGQVTDKGEPVVALDTAVDPVHRRNELLPDTRSELALPLRIGDEPIGALDVQSVEPNAFDEDDVAVFQTMADQLAVALRNAQLFEETQAALAEVEELNRRLTGQAWSRLVSRRDPAGPRAYRIEGDTVSSEEEGLPPEILDELRHESLARLDGEGDGELRVAVPISVRGEVIGAFGFGGEELENLTEEDIALIEAVAERVGIALENVRLFEQTQRQARREQLVNQITSRIVASTDVGDILQITARELGKVLRSPKTSIQLLGEQDDE